MTVTYSTAGNVRRNYNNADSNIVRRTVHITNEGSAATPVTPTDLFDASKRPAIAGLNSAYAVVLRPQVLHIKDADLVIGANTFWDDTNWTIIFDRGHTIQFYGCDARSGFVQGGVRMGGATYRIRTMNTSNIYSPLYLWHNSAKLFWHDVKMVWDEVNRDGDGGDDGTRVVGAATIPAHGGGRDRVGLGSLHNDSDIQLTLFFPSPNIRASVYTLIPAGTATIDLRTRNCIYRPALANRRAPNALQIIGQNIAGNAARLSGTASNFATLEANARGSARVFFEAIHGNALTTPLDAALASGQNVQIWHETNSANTTLTITNSNIADDRFRIGSRGGAIFLVRHQRTFAIRCQTPALALIPNAATRVELTGAFHNGATTNDGTVNIDAITSNRTIRDTSGQSGDNAYQIGTFDDRRSGITVTARALGYYSEQTTLTATEGANLPVIFNMRTDALDSAQAAQAHVSVTSSVIHLTANTSLDVLYRELKRWGRSNVALDEGFSRAGNELNVGGRTITGLEYLRPGTTLTQLRSTVNQTIPASLDNIIVPIISPNLRTARIVISGGASRSTFILNPAASPNTVLKAIAGAATQTATLNAITYPNILIKSRRINYTEWLSGSMNISSGGTFTFSIISQQKLDSDGNALDQGFTAASTTRISYRGATNRVNVAGAGASDTNYVNITAGELYASLEAQSLLPVNAPYEKPATFDGKDTLTLLHSYQLYNSTGTATTAILDGFFKQRARHGVADEANGEIEYRLAAETAGIENTLATVADKVAELRSTLENDPQNVGKQRFTAAALANAPATAQQQQGSGGGLTTADRSLLRTILRYLLRIIPPN